jgi:hypothetical protein
LIPSEETVLGNFGIGFRYALAPPAVDKKEYDVITWIDIKMRVYPEQAYRACEDDASFLEDFAGDGGFKLFTTFDAAPWEVPARPIGVAHEKYARFIEDGSLNAKRHEIGAPRDKRPDARQH